MFTRVLIKFLKKWRYRFVVIRWCTKQNYHKKCCSVTFINISDTSTGYNFEPESKSPFSQLAFVMYIFGERGREGGEFKIFLRILIWGSPPPNVVSPSFVKINLVFFFFLVSEPCRMSPCIIRISRRNQANMIQKVKVSNPLCSDSTVVQLRMHEQLPGLSGLLTDSSKTSYERMAGQPTILTNNKLLFNSDTDGSKRTNDITSLHSQ